MMWNWPLRGMKNKEEGEEVNMILDPFAGRRRLDLMTERRIRKAGRPQKSIENAN